MSAGDADDVAAVLYRIATDHQRAEGWRVVACVCVEQWPGRDWNAHREHVEGLILAAQPAAVPDPAETLRAAIEALIAEVEASTPPRPLSQIDAGIRASDRDWVKRLRAVLGDPSGALAEVRAEALRQAAISMPVFESAASARRWLKDAADRLAADAGSAP